METVGGSFVFLKPGDWILVDAPTHIKTILGSCVAVTVRSPRLGLAAMTHCLLPSARGALEPMDEMAAPRYVDTALKIVFDTFLSRGVATNELEVKLVGGADGLSQNLSRSQYSVGAKNVRTALREIAKRGITPAASVVGGRSGRVMVFNTATGELFVRRLAAMDSNRFNDTPFDRFGSLPDGHYGMEKKDGFA